MGWKLGDGPPRRSREARTNFTDRFLKSIMSSSRMLQELQSTFELLWMKLQRLPQADTIEIVAFTLILLFIAAVLVFMGIACCHCCCCVEKKRHRVIRIQPAI
ncbi:small integral membrane protein 5 [Ambystoma mexicanum]|uniref:small integral membrane protein 5 n=1 Tax=Ambystoma mexicanum TaxID=8296 RepID=UPI0037E83EFC